MHRLGQTHPVQVIHLLTEQSIEERVWETLKLKKALFSGLFDSTSDEVSFEKLGRKSTLQVIKEVFCDQPGRPKPIISPQAPAPLTVAKATIKQGTRAEPTGSAMHSARVVPMTAVAPSMPDAQGSGAPADSRRATPVAEVRQAAAKLLEAGLNFLETLAAPGAGASSSTDYSRTVEQTLSALFGTDTQTGRPILAIPLPESLTAERVANAVSGLLAKRAGAS